MKQLGTLDGDNAGCNSAEPTVPIKYDEKLYDYEKSASALQLHGLRGVLLEPLKLNWSSRPGGNSKRY
jgi:hypothetical protein